MACPRTLVVHQSHHAVDIVDVSGKRSTVPISRVKPYRSEPGEDVEATALIAYNDLDRYTRQRR